MAVKPRGLVALASLVLLMAGVAISTGTLLAADPPTTVAKPVADIQIVPVPADATNPNATSALLPDGKTKIALGASGLSNVSVGSTITLQGGATDPKLTGLKYAWTLTKPTSSKATLSSTNEPLVKLVADVTGVYKIDLVVSNDAGASPMESVQIRAGTYIGTGTGNCFQCHPSKTEEWSKTPHATKLQWEINGGSDPATSHYNEGCVRCHSVGYLPGASNGGFADVQKQTGWTFPSLESIEAGNDNWSTLPANLQNVGNIQCENCHGPASAHVANSSDKPAKSLDAGVCNVCHDGGGSHTRGRELANSAHSEADAQAWNYPTGPDHQDCVRCHSGAGFITFVENPTEKASWNNEKQTPTCAVCHDPHSDANPKQLRVAGKPVLANGVTKDFGLSAVCATCHNARVPASDAVKGSTPHYSPGAELLSDTGGVTYGQTVPNSPHGMVVGAAPVKNPADATGKSFLFGGDTPGPCVTCHMWPTPGKDDPNQFKVGSHSFNIVSLDGSFAYTAACKQCHGDRKSLDEWVSKADYDGNGKVETDQAEVAGLLKVLQQAIADSGIQPVTGHPYFDQANKANWTDKQKNAIYNYIFVRGVEGTDGKVAAVHNFKRSVALVQLSYKDLTGKDVPNGTIMK